MVLLTLGDAVTTALDMLQLDTGTVIRIMIALIVVITIIRCLGRIVWLLARIVAGALLLLVLVALLSRKPTRLANVEGLRQAAMESARELIN